MNILVTGARAPIAADIAQALSVAGHKVWVADNLRFPVSAGSPHIQGLINLPAPRRDFSCFVSTLRTACSDLALDVIIPTSEEVFWLAAAASSLPPSVDVRTSPLSTLAQLHHKGLFAQLSSRLGFGAVENFEITHRSELDRFRDPAGYVFKPVYSRFASRTLLSPTIRQLRHLQPSETDPWLAQTRVTGRELCAYNVADAGRLLLHVAYEPMFRIGVGASVYFSPVENADLRKLSERFIEKTNFTGQISFDVIETKTGLVALECNPRGTSGVHLAVQQPAALAASLLGRRAEFKTGFRSAPRMLLLPLLLNHPGSLFRRGDRDRLRGAQDALRAAGISFFAQAKAVAEMSGCAIRLRSGISKASTADIEWNGESIRG
ncbi:MAG: hypothetical protein ABI273_09470 [Lacunisphaera sp.]